MTTIDLVGMNETVVHNVNAINQLAVKGLISFNKARRLLKHLKEIHNEYVDVLNRNALEAKIITLGLPDKLDFNQVREIHKIY